jgi:hypothetical protein
MISTLEELNKMILLTIQKATPAQKREMRETILKLIRKDAGVSLTEMLVVLGVICTLGIVGIPILLHAFQSVKVLLGLVSGLVIH